MMTKNYKSPIKTIFFDLGNVLYSFDHTLMWNNLAKSCRTSALKLQSIVHSNNLWKLYEKGQVTIKDFVSTIESELSHSICLDDFIRSASYIFSPIEETITLTQKLKQNGYELILISNTCDIHFDHIQNHYKTLAAFKHFVLSYKLNLAKPEKEIFKHALSLTRSKPFECLFIDDLKPHIESAISLGIKAHQYKMGEDLKKVFSEKGIIL